MGNRILTEAESEVLKSIFKRIIGKLPDIKTEESEEKLKNIIKTLNEDFLGLIFDVCDRENIETRPVTLEVINEWLKVGIGPLSLNTTPMIKRLNASIYSGYNLQHGFGVITKTDEGERLDGNVFFEAQHIPLPKE